MNDENESITRLNVLIAAVVYCLVKKACRAPTERVRQYEREKGRDFQKGTNWEF